MAMAMPGSSKTKIVKLIKLESGDGKPYSIDIKAAMESKVIRDMLEELGADEDGIVIPVPTVHSFILEKVVEWAERHKNCSETANWNEKIEKRYEMSRWEKKFFKVSQNVLLNLAAAANFLDMPMLQSLACKEIAELLKGQPADEIRKQFGLPDDLSKEVKKQIRDEIQWHVDFEGEEMPEKVTKEKSNK